MKLPVVKPNITVYPIFSNPLSIILQNPYGLEWTYNNFHQLVCNDGLALSFYDFDYHNCSYILVQKISKCLISKLNKDIIEFLIESLDYGYYLYLNINPKYIGAYNLPRSLDVHDIFIYGYSKSERVFYIADCFENGKYAYNECSFDEIRNGIKYINLKDENYISLNGCIELLSLVTSNEKLEAFDYKRVKDTLKDYLNSKPTVCSNVQDFKWEYGETYHCFGISCYKYIHKKINLLNTTISFADFHIVWEHKRHLANTLNYMINRRMIIDNKNVLYKTISDITNKALCGRNLAIKCSIKYDDAIKEKLHLIYQDIETMEYYFLLELIEQYMK